MAKQEITLQGLDGQVDELVLTTNGEAADVSLEDCARMLFPQEGEAVPRLRFKGFEGNWKEKTIGDLCYSQPSTITQESLTDLEGQYPVYGASGFIKNIDSYQQDVPYIGVVKDGAGVGRVGLYPAYSSILGTMHYLLPKNGYDIVFLTYLLERIDLTQTSSGSTIPHIYFKDYKEIKTFVPSFEEQVTIATFFKRLDSQSFLHQQRFERLRQLKSACLNSMFPQNNSTTPLIRFKGYSDDWETVSFKDITKLSGIKNRENLPLESYSISSEHGFVPQNEQFEKGGTMSKADKRLYYIVTPDSFAYNPARINIGSIGYDDLDKDVIVSSLYVVFKTDEKTYNPFLKYWFKSPAFKKMIEQYQEGGVRLYFFYDKLCKCNFRRPTLDEQKQIAAFLSDLDLQISTQQERLERLRQMKTACLDNLFPLNGGGQKLPHIRFKEYTEEWVMVKLSIIAKPYFVSNKRIHHQNLLSLSYGQIVRKDIQTKKGLLPASFDTYQVVQDGIIVFRFTDLQNDHKSLRVGLAKEEGIISPAYVCVKCENVLPEFLYLQLHTYDLRKVFYSMGDGMRQTLSYSDIKDMPVFVPSIEEQKRIVSLANSFDKQITAQTQQIEKLKQMKKACLSQMIA